MGNFFLQLFGIGNKIIKIDKLSIGPIEINDSNDKDFINQKADSDIQYILDNFNGEDVDRIKYLKFVSEKKEAEFKNIINTLIKDKIDLFNKVEKKEDIEALRNELQEEIRKKLQTFLSNNDNIDKGIIENLKMQKPSNIYYSMLDSNDKSKVLNIIKGDKDKPCAKERFKIFISASTEDEHGNKTREYELAKRIKDFFKLFNIGVFWWEDNELERDFNSISTKISVGLGFSSIFLSLAFDKSLDTLNDNKKIPDDYFSYEVKTFNALLKEEKYSNYYYKNILTNEEIVKYAPKNSDRVLYFFSNKERAHDKCKCLDNNKCIFIDNETKDNDILKSILERICLDQFKDKISKSDIETFIKDETQLIFNNEEKYFTSGDCKYNNYHFEYTIMNSKTGEIEKNKFRFINADNKVFLIANEWCESKIIANINGTNANDTEDLKYDHIVVKKCDGCINPKSIENWETNSNDINILDYYYDNNKNDSNKATMFKNFGRFDLDIDSSKHSNSGFLELYKGTKLVDTYIFIINYYEKKIIKYKVKKSFRKVRFTFSESLPVDLRVNVKFSKNLPPIKKDYNKYKTIIGKGKSTLTIKKEARHNYYRLSPDDAYKNFITLMEESSEKSKNHFFDQIANIGSEKKPNLCHIKDKALVNVAIVGQTSVGKSFFISKLLNVKSMGELKAIPQLSYINDFLSNYGFSVEVDNKSDNYNKLTTGKDNKGNSLGSNHKTYLDYKSEPFESVPKATEGYHILPPCSIVVKKNTDKDETIKKIVFNDTPGELIKNKTNYENVIAKNDVIILLVNNNRDVLKASKEFVDYAFKDGSLKRKMILVVYSQFDNFENNYDINSYIMHKFNNYKKTFYKSEYYYYINMFSKEVENLLRIQDASNIVETVNRNPYYKYFCVSSIGSKDTIFEIDGEKYYKYINEKRGFENIIIWLFYQLGIVK
ncbi:MAG: hypothetical protein IKP77_03175 [Acholeplasmatales bacterium]|nr:hypothetical protein [Acholeplasmatales bacterium]